MLPVYLKGFLSDWLVLIPTMDMIHIMIDLMGIASGRSTDSDSHFII